MSEGKEEKAEKKMAVATKLLPRRSASRTIGQPLLLPQCRLLPIR
jgi:hypothetical protein